jgi:phage terminase small subunit
MNKRRERFIAEYLIDYDPVRAAIAAGYSKKSAYNNSQKMLKITEIALEINVRSREILAKCEMSASEVCLRLTRIARVNLGHYCKWGPNGVEVIPSDQLTEEQRECVSEVVEDVTVNGSKVKFKLFDKKAALDSLAKRHGLFQEKEPQPTAIQVNIIDHYGPPEGEVKNAVPDKTG